MRLVLEIACTRLARPEADLTIEHWPSAWPAWSHGCQRRRAGERGCCSGRRACSIRTAAAQQPTLISGARAAAPAASAAPLLRPRAGRMPWDRGAAVPAAQPASRSASVSASKPAAPAPQPAPTPTPQPLRLPRLPPLRHLSPSPTMPPRLPPPVLPRRPRSRMPESCSANGPRLSSVSRRVRLPTRGFCSMPAPRLTTAPGSRSRSPRLDLCHQDAWTRRHAVGGPADSQCGLRSSYRRLCPGWGWHAGSST